MGGIFSDELDTEHFWLERGLRRRYDSLCHGQRHRESDRHHIQRNTVCRSEMDQHKNRRCLQTSYYQARTIVFSIREFCICVRFAVAKTTNIFKAALYPDHFYQLIRYSKLFFLIRLANFLVRNVSRNFVKD